jgi:hypothetical protein
MIQAYFSNIGNIILNEIQNSKKEILIAVAWFTQRDLFNAVLVAIDRGVKVSLILINDIINRNEYGLDFSLYLQKGGKLCFVDSRKVLMHNKFCLFDGHILLTGSYNWTYAAEQRNAENIIITDEINVCNDYTNYFTNLWNSLTEVTEYSHVNLSSITADNLLQEYDDIVEEYKSMEHSNIIKPETLKTVYDLKDNIAITKLATVVSQNKRHNPTLKLNIGMRCRINNIDDRTLNIIKQGQTLPFTNTVETCTVVDNQEQIICDILFGNNDDADKNKSILKIKLENLPKLKAGQVKFKTKVTIDTNGYIHVEFVCINTGMAKEAIYIFPDIISY